MARQKPVKSQFEICTQDCGGRCCRYITVEVPPPRARRDWDEMRWWLAHEGVMVSKDEDRLAAPHPDALHESPRGQRVRRLSRPHGHVQRVRRRGL